MNKLKMWCLVNLPNGTTFGVQLNNPKAIGQECLEKVIFFWHLVLNFFFTMLSENTFFKWSLITEFGVTKVHNALKDKIILF